MWTVSERALMRRAGDLGVSRPGWHQTPVQQGDRTGGVLIHPTRCEVLTRRTVVARLSIRRQRRTPHAVQVANLFSGQLLSETAAHRRFLRPAGVPSSSRPDGTGSAVRPSRRPRGRSSLPCPPCLDGNPSDLGRGELAGLEFGGVAQREGRWAIVDLVGKHGRVPHRPDAVLGLRGELRIVGTTPLSKRAVSTRRSKFVVRMTLMNPSAASAAMARCAGVGCFSPSSRSRSFGSQYPRRSCCRSAGVLASSSRRSE